ncbi:MAG: hypothetical protein ACE5KH_06665, partial [Candidatus Geothermarchaeales archaeon]
MVEVWLPFGDTELPVMIPEPTTLREIVPPPVDHEREEPFEQKLDDLASEVGDRTLNVVFDHESNRSQRDICLEFLSRAALKIVEVDEPEPTAVLKGDPNSGFTFRIDRFPVEPLTVLAGVCQPSSVLGWSGYPSAILRFLPSESSLEIFSWIVHQQTTFGETGQTLSALKEALSACDPLSVSFVLSPQSEVADFRLGFGSEPWADSVATYARLWTTEEPLEGLVLASSGGRPWDDSFLGSLRGLFNLVASGAERIIYLAEARGDLEVDLTKFWKAMSERRA